MGEPLQHTTSPDAKPQPNLAGGAGTAIWGGRIDDLDPNLKVRDNWLDDFGGTWGTARKMMLDSYVGQAVEGVTDTIYGADHDFEPGDDSPLAKEIADFCRHALTERLNWTKVLERTLHYFRDGVSLLECSDDIRAVSADRFPNHPDPARAVLYTAFQHRQAGSIDQWYQAPGDATKLDRVVQYVNGSDVEVSGYRDIAAPFRLLRFTWQQEGANFLGQAPIRRAYGPWYRKIVLVAVAMIAHERHHVGVPTIIWEEAAKNIPQDEVEKVKTILLNIRAHEKAMAMFPPSVKSFAFTSAPGGTDIEHAIREANYEIMHTFAGGWQLLGSSGGNGSYALAQTQQGRPNVVTHRHIDFIDDVWNHGADGWSPIERLVRLNYGPTAPLPKKVTRNIPTVDYTHIAGLLPQLISSKVITPDAPLEKTVRKWMLLPSQDEESARVSSETILLNGAQLAEQRNLMQSVVGKDGLIPSDNAVAFLVTNFGMDQAAAESIVPEPPAQTAPQQLPLFPASDGAKDGAEEEATT